MEEVFRREKEEADRLLREQKLEYETKIVELQKQVMETSINQSMVSSNFSFSGLGESSSVQLQTLLEDRPEADNETINRKCFADLEMSIFRFSSDRLFLVGTGLSISLVDMEKMALPSNDIVKGTLQ